MLSERELSKKLNDIVRTCKSDLQIKDWDYDSVKDVDSYNLGIEDTLNIVKSKLAYEMRGQHFIDAEIRLRNKRYKELIQEVYTAKILINNKLQKLQQKLEDELSWIIEEPELSQITDKT